MTSWARWRPEIAKAVCSGHQTIESIEADLAEGRAKLWATDACCMIVEVHRYVGGHVACQILYAAGSIKALGADLPALEADMKACGCTEVLINGPMGWTKPARGYGYEPWAVTLRKEL